jgi:hypothetical protein
VKHRIQSFLKLVLGLWLGAGLLSANLLTHLPELHAELHQHAHSHQDGDHDHHHSDEQSSHSCLVQFLAGGSVDSGPTPIDFLIGPITFNECRLLDAPAVTRFDVRRLPPVRAPPTA